MTPAREDPAPLPEEIPGPVPIPIPVFQSLPAFIRRNFLPAVFLVLVIGILYVVSRYNFALFHTAIEFATIAIAVAIFLLVWKSRHIVQNNYLLFVGITFVFIAILDFLHTTVYQGVGIFAGGGGPLSTQLWIAARYLQAVTLFAAPLLMRKKLRLDLIAVVYLVADIVIVASVFIFVNFPTTYIEGAGLTPFKIFSEYLISFLLIGAVVLLYKNRALFDRQVLDNLIIAIVLTILSEIAFTEYASFIDILSVIGHVLRLLAYYFFYRAIIEVGQEKPYNLLYRELNESEKNYRALIDLFPDGIVILRDTKIIFTNRAGLRMAGVTATDDLVGKDFSSFIHPEERDAAKQAIDRILDTRQTVPLTEMRLLARGREIPAEVTAGPVVWDGRPAVQVVIRDITERKKTGAAIADLNRDREMILNTMPAMIWYKDTRNNFIRVNAAVSKITGLEAGAFEGKNTREIFPDEAEVYYEDDLAVIRSGEPRYGIVEPLAVAGGRKIWVQTDKIPLRDETGAVSGILVFSLDISKRKAAEEALEQRNNDLRRAYGKLTAAQEELQQKVDELTIREGDLRENAEQLSHALAEKEVLLSEIHHRVKNNLTAFISLLSLEGSYTDTIEGRNLKKDLQNRARSMALIHETLYRTGKFSSVDMNVYLSNLLDQIAASYAAEIPVHPVVEAEGVDLDLARATPCGLIINEIVTNSFKYAFPGTFDCARERGEPCTIRISLVLDNGEYILTVSDNGVGLPAGFDPLTAKSMGLKLVTFLARYQLRAEISVKAANGTAFIFRFSQGEEPA